MNKDDRELFTALIESHKRAEAAFEADRKLRRQLIEGNTVQVRNESERNKTVSNLLLASQVIRTVVDLAIFGALVWIILGLNI